MNLLLDIGSGCVLYKGAAQNASPIILIEPPDMKQSTNMTREGDDASICETCISDSRDWKIRDTHLIDELRRACSGKSVETQQALVQFTSVLLSIATELPEDADNASEADIESVHDVEDSYTSMYGHSCTECGNPNCRCHDAWRVSSAEAERRRQLSQGVSRPQASTSKFPRPISADLPSQPMYRDVPTSRMGPNLRATDVRGPGQGQSFQTGRGAGPGPNWAPPLSTQTSVPSKLAKYAPLQSINAARPPASRPPLSNVTSGPPPNYPNMSGVPASASLPPTSSMPPGPLRGPDPTNTTTFGVLPGPLSLIHI